MPVTSYTTIDGEIISENRGGTERDYVSDALGSTIALLDSTQTKTDTWTYWPYGEVKSRTGTNATPFQFVGTRGYHRDSSIKTYIRARYLDMQRGRWSTQDPIRFGGYDWNLYSYATSNPTTIVDPSGWGSKCPSKPKAACFACAFKIGNATGEGSLIACRAASAWCGYTPPGGCSEWTKDLPPIPPPTTIGPEPPGYIPPDYPRLKRAPCSAWQTKVCSVNCGTLGLDWTCWEDEGCRCFGQLEGDVVFLTPAQRGVL